MKNEIKRNYHGTVVLKENLIDNKGHVFRHIGEQGVITAFLPENDIYAVMFDGKIGIGNWFGFDGASFRKFFTITQTLS